MGGGCRADARKNDARFNKEFWFKRRFLEEKTALNIIEMHAPYRMTAFFFCVYAYEIWVHRASKRIVYGRCASKVCTM